jgi:Serine dehydrogenase proteinase
LLETVAQRNALIASIEKARGSSLIAYFLHDNAMIADDALPQLYDKLQALGKREKIDLLLYTRGGVTEVCWRALNLVREYCDHLGVIVGTRVMGAGTLLALGANEIVMGPLSELGSMESARRHPLLPRDDAGQQIPVTLGEIKALGLGAVSLEATDSKAAEDGTSAGSFNPLFSYIHPLAIGNLLQADALSRDVTRKALQMHIPQDDNEKIERLVDLFNGGFHSPVYTVGRTELQDAGLSVTVANKELWGQIWSLVQLYHASLYNDRPDQATPGSFFRYVCVIESQGRSTGLRQVYTHVDGMERVTQMGWETAIKGPVPGPSFGPGGMSNN